MNIAPHHEEGSPVLVRWPLFYKPAVVRNIVSALDREYRVDVISEDGRRWLDLAPECVIPRPLEAA